MRNNKENIGNNLWFPVLFVLGAAVAIVVKIFIIQWGDSEKYAHNAKRLIDVKEIKPPKGNIYADNGALLVTTIPEYNVHLDMKSPYIKELAKAGVLGDSLKVIASGIYKMKYGDFDKANFELRFMKAYKVGNRYFSILKNLSQIELDALKDLPIFNKGRYKGGLIYEQVFKRKRPHGILAHRTLGYVRDNGAAVGLERSFNEEISGSFGTQLQKRIGKVWIPVNNDYMIEPVPGADLHTTIDVNIQDVAENALLKRLIQHNAKRGCVVVMEVQTGRIKAIANLSRTSSGNYFENYNDAIGASTEPGSTFKLASYLVAMEDGYLKLTDSVHRNNGTQMFYDLKMRDSKPGGYGPINFQDAFAFSSNVAIAYKINEAYGHQAQKFIEGVKRLGVNQKTGVEIDGEGSPLIRNTGDKLWSGISLPQMSIGYEVQLTPIQILNLYNAVANNGKMMKPTLVKGINKDGEWRENEPEVMMGQIASERTIKEAQKMLEAVVDYGTANSIKNPFFKIAGKTGTAQMLNASKLYQDTSGRKIYQASFAGYFPAENPQYSCIVVVSAPSENGYYASEVAAPIFKEIAYKIMAKNLIKDKEEDQRFVVNAMPYSSVGSSESLKRLCFEADIATEGARGAEYVIPSAGEKEVLLRPLGVKQDRMPNVKGMNLRDAIFLLENLGLKIELKGGLGTVKQQSVYPGTSISKGQRVVLRLTE